MSTLVVPLRLLLLASEPYWAAALREHLPLASAHHAVLLTAPNWDAVDSLFADDRLTIVLTTPDLQPCVERCGLPMVLLLEQEPQELPLGVSDWLVQGQLTPDTLRRCLRHVRERRLLETTLQRLTELDPLTGVANRQGFQALLTRRLAEHEGRGVALGHLDLDNFRHVNDALGHQVGDRLILQVVDRLKRQLGPDDQIARLGSDEFALLIDTRQQAARAEQVARHLVDALSEAFWVEGESVLLGCSLGIAHARAHNGPDPLMWHAHIAMQQAKRRRGCTFHVFDERINRHARSLADLESELRRALRRDELELHYQPRLDLASGRIVGLEALVRWRHGERGLLPPGEFIPLAEQSGLIVPLGYWVIARALRDTQVLRARGLAPLHIAVNLSFRQFHDSQLLATLSRQIAEYGIDASWLEFELTETAVMHCNERVQQTLDALGRLGVRFSLDDFGTGFSSFVHLNSLPITLLKVDRSFVAGMELREESRKLVQAMINLAHNLNLHVVAEGIENERQLALLRDYGCDQVQGFLVSRALPIDELSAWLRETSARYGRFDYRH